MSTRRRNGAAWPLERKFTLWLSDHGLTLNAFARRHGLQQPTLYGWIRRGRRIPGSALSKIAAATHLPADYWLNDEIPYPPPLEYLNLADEVLSALKAIPLAQLFDLLEMLRDPDDLHRTLTLRRAARERPKGPP